MTEIYSIRLKNRSDLMNSSSGGAFTAISDVFLAQGYPVVCSVYNVAEKRPEMKMVRTAEERNKARGSIYVQSYPGDCIKDAIEWLKGHESDRLLFVGLGCQAAAFKQLARLNDCEDRAFTVGIICHGVPSAELWRDYVRMLEKAHGSACAAVSFKDKRNGWLTPTAVAKFGDEEVNLNGYVRLFYNHCALRPSCYQCPYTVVDRDTDMTIGDFWHIEERVPAFYDEMGNSLLLIHSEEGRKLFERIKPAVYYHKSNAEECWQSHLEKPTPMGKKRDVFQRDLAERGIQYVLKKHYGDDSLYKRIIKKVLAEITRPGGGKAT